MTIDSFKDEYSWLSNMSLLPIQYKGRYFCCTESAYQAEKCANERDKDMFIHLNGYESKKLGRNIQIRDDWNEVRLQVMEELTALKYTPHTPLAIRLLETGDAEIVEGNNWKDTFWGICNGIGENHLGKILMSQRAKLKEEGVYVGVVGSRRFLDSTLAFKVLDRAHAKFNIVKVVSGGAVGPDKFGEWWANKNGIEVLLHLPNWDAYGKSAGFIRNADIVRDSDFIIAFWDTISNGTKNTMDTAFKQGKRVFYFTPKGEGFKYDPRLR